MSVGFRRDIGFKVSAIKGTCNEHKIFVSVFDHSILPFYAIEHARTGQIYLAFLGETHYIA